MGRPPSVRVAVLLKSEHRSFVLNRRNTDGHFSCYNLFQNTDLSQNVQAKFNRNVNLVICHVSCRLELCKAKNLTDNLANISLELPFNISVQICILESIVTAVMFICISSIEYKKAMLRFQ